MPSEFLDAAAHIAEKAGEMLMVMLPEAREAKGIRTKRNPADLVTRADVHGVPLFAVSLGLEYRGELVAGVVHHPPMGEMFLAERGIGAFLQKGGERQRMRVSDAPSVGESVVATGLPYDIVEKGTNVSQIGKLCRAAREVRILGAAALHLAYVAAGRLEAFWEQNLNPWDVAAGVLLVKEAGGRVTHLRGGPFQIDGRHVLATNARIHDEMIELLGD